jgi:hypothetical protein
MPQFDGMDALRLATELAPDTPFIFVCDHWSGRFVRELVGYVAIEYRLQTAAGRSVDSALALGDPPGWKKTIGGPDRVLSLLVFDDDEL